MGFLLLLFLIPISLLIFLAVIVRPKPSTTTIPIKNRHVFITGGSSGIGLAMAHQAALAGAQVSILARDKIQEAKDWIKLATGCDVAVYEADVRDYDAVSRAVNDAGPIDVLICNQGLFFARELERQSLEEIKSMIDVNLLGTFHLIKAALPGMKEKRAGRSTPRCIALTSSQAGQMGIYGYAAYCASKFGLRGMAEALQQEIIQDDIHVSLIFPPDTETPGLVEDKKRRPPITGAIAAFSTPMKAEEVAKKALNGIQCGVFNVHCNLEGFFMSIIAAGFSPQRSVLMAFIEVIGASMGRIIALGFQFIFYQSITKLHARKK
ncbi:OLC1v1030324C1 [Oldenlandia corymbosa var. corymbosa]|uniref:3-dehydrosphinganine reductase n=1 Tax=Oldenlandia corymbosa var. corymbosa TaxID=529605 RepID=A0AAV1CFS2_OLDCO|nr:OLC1v1030324C1 [Oldenlandia corymbosa var. corymbosa]